MAKSTPPPRFKDPVGTFPISFAQILFFLIGFFTIYYLQVQKIMPALDPALIRKVIPDLPRFSDFYIDHVWFYGYPVIGGFLLSLIWTILVEFRNWRHTIAP